MDDDDEKSLSGLLTEEEGNVGVVENYTARAIEIAGDNRHGYSQMDRWGPDFDCSSFVIWCLQNAGIPARDRGATYTGDMRKVLLSCGFRNVTGQCNLATGAGMQRGDILLNDRDHTAIYIGGGQIVHARSSEGNALQGDQSGNEIRVQPYFNYPWGIVLRYAGADTAPAEDDPAGGATAAETEVTTTEEPKDAGSGFSVSPPVLRYGTGGPWVAAMQGALKFHGFNLGPWGVDGDFGAATETALRNFQTSRGLTADGVCGPLTWTEIFESAKR